MINPKPEPEVTLPARPRVLPGLPVLERGRGEVQIGLDPRHGMVVSGLSPVLVSTLRSLDGSRATTELFGLVGSDEAEELRMMLTKLTRLGLIEDAGPAGPLNNSAETALWSLRTQRSSTELATERAHCAVSIRGGGRLAVAMATLLANAGVGHIEIRAKGQVTERDLGSGYTEGDLGRPRAQAMAAAIRRASPMVRTTRLTDRRLPELVLLTDSVVPAPEVVGELHAEGLPHLVVRVREGLGLVGPLVYPGRSSCLRCADLYRSGADSSWPTVAGQLAGREQEADAANIYAVAGFATRQALRVLHYHHEPPPTWNGVLELDTYSGKLRRRHWSPHPACGCGAVELAC
ncbi:TOMM precursor leader peptide-binding protein [Amycolatopsis sp. 195334CR]|uniref:TOMM precursor leader peptide-binding protein n=1 Tax=Amycolatopsis sp. 195334CR TaxID=2814588 RepID=UPI001A9011D8|nr:TOMM precursor leader peptide-binding protein [Amycolatopsis sp. 195334CR]MBN6034269.1 TOMM precursor leader peptide-binding protein [Amycolatopsis sp. 195334CR]